MRMNTTINISTIHTKMNTKYSVWTHEHYQHNSVNTAACTNICSWPVRGASRWARRGRCQNYSQESRSHRSPARRKNKFALVALPPPYNPNLGDEPRASQHHYTPISVTVINSDEPGGPQQHSTCNSSHKREGPSSIQSCSQWQAVRAPTPINKWTARGYAAPPASSKANFSVNGPGKS